MPFILQSKEKVSKIEFNKGIYADVALAWEPSDSDVSHYEIYRKLPNNEKEFVGATPNHVYFLSNLKRNGKESSTNLEIVAVNKEFKRSEPTAVTFEWPPYPKPEADFRCGSNGSGTGREDSIFQCISEVTEAVEWHFEGGTPSVSNEENPVVTYEKEGVYPVTLIAKNSEGESVLTKEAMITISEAAKDIKNVALNKTAIASGQCAPSEAANMLLTET